MRHRVRRVHFVGIGGAGMSGLAEILHASGYAVSGSDARESETTRRLAARGIALTIGHAATSVVGADVVVHSSAIAAGNPELRAAQARGIPVISRAEMLAELMRMKYGVAVSGSHGKTTTTTLVAEVLAAGGLDPTSIVGGRVHSLGANSRLGAGDVLVAEADESDGSFLHLAPTVVVITNIDHEHLEHYGSFEALVEAFATFAQRVPFYGLDVLCLDDPVVQGLLPRLSRRVCTYGLSPQADVSATQVEPDGFAMRFAARAHGRALGELRLPLLGAHNVVNALAALAVGLEFDVPFERARAALESFGGVARRFERCGEREGVLVVEDYGHHPTEIRATLSAARAALGRRLVVVFQPHRYSRTRDLFDALAGAFHDADQLILTEIYAAGEDKIPGVSAQALAAAIRERGHRAVEYVGESEQIVGRVRERVRAGDVLIFLGAGDVGRLARVFLGEGDAG
jgi:UDP-N-acetylmuramate--alanine ligase